MNKTTTPDPHDLDRLFGQTPKLPELSATAKRKRTRDRHWERVYRVFAQGSMDYLRDELKATRKEVTAALREHRAEINNRGDS